MRALSRAFFFSDTSIKYPSRKPWKTLFHNDTFFTFYSEMNLTAFQQMSYAG